MPNIFHQSVEDILKAATPEQRLIWNYIFLNYGERVAISQLVTRDHVAILGVYSARRVFFAYNLIVKYTNATTPSATPASIILYNEANVNVGLYTNDNGYWDATAAAARYMFAPLIIKNEIFSRILINYSTVWFVGYMINY